MRIVPTAEKIPPGWIFTRCTLLVPAPIQYAKGGKEQTGDFLLVAQDTKPYIFSKVETVERPQTRAQGVENAS